MTNQDIEDLSIQKLKNMTVESQILYAEVNSNDKTPSWDGYIYLYKDDKAKGKNNLEKKVPIQMKGQKVKKFNCSEVSYQVSISDLKNYYNDGGVIFFLAQIVNKDNVKMFYKILLCVDIKNILSSVKNSSQKTKGIKLKEIKRDTQELEDILLEFKKNVDRQPVKSVEENSYYIKDLASDTKISIDFSSLSFDKEYYVYALPKELNQGRFKVEIPILNKIKLDLIKQTIQSNISVNNRIFYSNYTVCRKEDALYFEIGDKIILDIFYKEIKVLNPSTNLENYLNTLYLLKDIVEYGHMRFDSTIVPIENFLNYDEVKKMIDYIENLKDLLIYLHIDTHRFSVKYIHEESYDKILYLRNALMYNEKIKLKNNIKKTTTLTVEICRQRILVLANYISEDKYELVDILDDKKNVCIYSIYGKDMHLSPYFIFYDDMNYVNFNIRLAEKSITKYNCTHEYAELVNNFILILLTNYDKYDNNNFIELALNLCNWILKYYNDDIYLLNKYQIIKRMRKLNENELKNLIDIKYSTSDVNMLCCINILTDNIKEAIYILDKMSEEDKNIFKSFPIYNLLESKKIYLN